MSAYMTKIKMNLDGNLKKDPQVLFDEVERMIANPSEYKSFNSAEEMMEDIMKDDVSN